MSRGWRRWERIIAREERRAARAGTDPWAAWADGTPFAARYDAWTDAHLERLWARRDRHPEIAGFNGWGPLDNPEQWTGWRWAGQVWFRTVAHGPVINDGEDP